MKNRNRKKYKKGCRGRRKFKKFPPKLKHKERGKKKKKNHDSLQS